MLFLEGTRDDFATPELLRGVIDQLGRRATVHLIDDGDHHSRCPSARVRRKRT